LLVVANICLEIEFTTLISLCIPNVTTISVRFCNFNSLEIIQKIDYYYYYYYVYKDYIIIIMTIIGNL